MIESLIGQLKNGKPLSPAQISDVVRQLVAENVGVELKADFLTALAIKGETPEEIAAFAMELRALSIQPPIDAQTRAREILDVCGTGGDHLGTFNISTTVAIVCAAAGVTVAKHGNRAITSKAGSADVLEALGVKIDLSPEESARRLRDHGFAFFFAPNYHPAFKHISPARKLCASRGQRTIFNYLGPLLNPARPTAQLMGVPFHALCEPMAHVLQTLGVRRGMVVSGKVPSPMSGVQNLDELSTLGENVIAEFYQERGFTTSTLDPNQFPLQPATLDDLIGGDRDTNAEIIRRILRGEDRGPKRDAVLLNAGAALFVAGSVRSMSGGWEKAALVLDDGAAWTKLLELWEK
ncbi:MAG: anthranilate phosphoribosyltransferase [Verrucomicrobia bacterium]|nr:anthranilate phosphoribosyltransferase [Verrucomicrobiota bacterium]